MIMIWQPEICILVGLLSILLSSIWRDDLILPISVVSVLGALYSLYTISEVGLSYWSSDMLATGGKAIVLLTSGLIILMVYQYLDRKGMSVTLILSAILGSMVVLSSQEYLLLFLGIELIAIPSYVLCSMSNQSDYASEAGLKYFVMGSLSTLLFLYGVSLLYMATGSFDFAAAIISGKEIIGQIGATFVFTAFVFKIGLFPFHYWVPDVYQASKMSLSIWVISVPKVAYLLAIYRLQSYAFSTLAPLAGIVGATSLLFGVLMASVQADFRRMLGYASISQMGIVFLLVSTYDQFGWQLALSYLVVYVFSLVLLWQIVLPLDQEDLLPIQSLSDFAKAYPLQAVGLSLILISMAGIPLTIGFVAKVSAIYLLVQQAYYYSLAILVISLPIAVYYYLGVVRVMLFNLNSQIGQKVLVNYYTMLGVALIIILSLYMDTLFSFSRVVLQGS